MKNTERVAIMLRPRKDIHERISAAARELDKPITAWVMDAIMAKLPHTKIIAAIQEAPQEPAEGKNKHERAALIMPRALEIIKEQGHEWISVGDVAEILDTGIDDTALAMINLWMKEKATIQNREDNRNDIRKENVRYRAV